MNTNKKHYLVYKITNIVNGKIYIGCHATDDKDDGYMGSGAALKKAINKYGKKCFTKEVLQECGSPQEMLDLERALVNKEFVAQPNTYNMTIGGVWDGRDDRSKTEEFKNKLKGKKRTEESINKMRGKVVVKDQSGKIFKVSKEDERYLSGELTHNSKGKKHTKETIDKIKIAHTGKKHSESTKNKLSQSSIGDRNSFYGKSHSEQTKERISKKKLGTKLKPFSEKHRNSLSLNKKGKKWITSPDLKDIKQVSPEMLQEYLESGWILGYKHQIK